MPYKNLITRYFDSFSKKDIDTISELFADNIVLQDWNIYEVGKANVLKANSNIFDSIEEIKVIPITFYKNSDTLYAVQIEIQTNSDEKIRVIDVIEFNGDGKINKITAFIID